MGLLSARIAAQVFEYCVAVVEPLLDRLPRPTLAAADDHMAGAQQSSEPLDHAADGLLLRGFVRFTEQPVDQHLQQLRLVRQQRLVAERGRQAGLLERGLLACREVRPVETAPPLPFRHDVHVLPT
ncbi:MAG TPA: hypothetical protein VMM93_14580 [Vicinamibacterales bacterium]|nr:hypothetical protein [Vicinamibacterales bacterium]